MDTVSHSTRSKRARLEPVTYSLAEFAALAGCSYTTFHEMARAGTLPVAPLKIGRIYKFPRAAVHRLLEIDVPADDAA